MQVDFYILEETSGLQSFYFACQLIEKLYTTPQSIYIHADSRLQAEQVDSLLWTYQDSSFIPHQLCEQTKETSFIEIGYTHAPLHKQNILINLCQVVPIFYQQCKHVIEIVFTDASVQQLARERFKLYRQQNCEINTYKINASEYK